MEARDSRATAVSTRASAGTLKILRFNSGAYAAGLIFILLALTFLYAGVGPSWLRSIIFLATGLAGFWILSSLGVSWWVYDHARVTAWQWLPQRLLTTPRRWAHVHSGFDEATSLLHGLFPNGVGCTIDIHDPGSMTEPSIARARRIYPPAGGQLPGRFDNLPLPDRSCDTVFLLMSAHEVRASNGRLTLLREVRRILTDDGQVVLVEHLRDGMNLIAFGPGFLHFFSAQSWRLGLAAADLQVRHETPLLRKMGGGVEGCRVLEVGCGAGVGIEILLDQWKARYVCGVDLDPAQIARAAKRLANRDREGFLVSIADAEQLPFPDASFDAVFDFGILHHVPRWQNAVGEVARVLKPEGRFFFEEITRKALETWLYRAFLEHPRGNRFSEAEFLDELSRQGFELAGAPRHILFGDGFAGAATLACPRPVASQQLH